MTQPKKSYSSFLFVLAVLAIGSGLTAYLMMTAPTTEPVEKAKALKIVQTIAAEPSNESVHVRADGVVIPTREVTIKPEVRGRVLEHHEALVAGGHVSKGEKLVYIDRADYELALKEHQAALEEAEFAIAVEEGRQVVAKREFGLLEKDLDASSVNQALVLREPHLKRAQAMLAMAQNEIAKAELALTRTTINAPFNAVVIEESIEVGQLVASGDSICKLAGIDAFWVRVTIPFEDLRWIKMPANEMPGSTATVFLDKGNGIRAEWPGIVERLLGDLDPETRMARVLIRVDDPSGHLATGDSTHFPLLLGSYVSVDIDAGILENVITIPRKALHDDKLWLVDGANELQIRATSVLWKGNETLFVKNVLKEGEQVIVSDLRAALPGMKVSPQSLPTPDKKQ
ncbi:MAG: RND family efflux transporter MFP subunit [Verrucomicrobiales bacterium]